jgi:hypothetical protein
MSFASLLDAALAGTQRQDPPIEADALANVSREARLLRGASIQGMRRLAGQRAPGSVVRSGPPAPADSLPVPPAAAAARIGQLIYRRDLLVEWLEIAKARGFRLPHASLVDLLEVGREDPEIAELVELLGGERVGWLAAQNPAWSFAARIEPESAYSDGAPQVRIRALRSIRRADPARGRAMLSETWEGESADARAGLLAVLEHGLEAGDEALLQRAIGDARREVRAIALQLVRRLPDSSFGQRWTERARAVVLVRRMPLGVQGVDVRAPAVLDPEWIADGVEARPPRGFGPAGWWLRQMMALTPPDTWPEVALPSLRRGDWASVLVPGLAEAAAAYCHEGWCEALLLAWVEAGAGRAQLGIDQQSLLGALPPTRAEAVLRRIFDVDPGALLTLLHVPRHWSAPFAQFAIEQAQTIAGKSSYALSALLRLVAERADPAVLGVAEEMAERVDLASYRELVRRLEYRSMLRRELGSQ